MKKIKTISTVLLFCMLGFAASGCQGQKAQSSAAESSELQDQQNATEPTELQDQQNAAEPTQLQDQLSAEEQGLLAYGGILSTLNEDVFTQLAPDNVPDLIAGWDISDSQTAIEALEWLKNEGHRTDCNHVLSILKAGTASDYEDLQDLELLYKRCNVSLSTPHNINGETLAKVVSIDAWDYARIVNVSRWCYAEGYITEDQAWTYIKEAKRLSQESFDSWEEYYASYLYGRAIAYDGHPKELEPAGEILLNDTNSIWRTTSFK